MFTHVKHVAGFFFAVSALVCATQAVAQNSPNNLSNPKASHGFAVSQPIAGKYIVVFKPSVNDAGAQAAAIMRGLNGQIHHTYNNALKGFSASLPAAALVALQNNPLVDYIEADKTIALNQLSSPQNQATWGLDRIDQSDRPLDSQYRFNASGSGVSAFIIDTGIRADHLEFSGRIKPGYTVITDSNGSNDCNGHGTHVAGSVGGATWGVAKNVWLIPVRVLNCTGSGSSSGVISGIDWVAGNSARPAVANLSLGGSFSSALNAAVAGAVNKGVSMVVAAGNSSADACAFSPASEPNAISVGASTSSDAMASYSNFGKCVAIFAPGSSITSAWNSSNTASNTISGTSMATPHVAGVAALVLETNPTASPASVAAFLSSNATQNRLSSLGAGSPNRLLYSLAAGAPTEPSTQTVAIKSLSGRSAKSGNGWRAYVTAAVRDVSSGAAVANASVSGSFSSGGTASCVTSSSGSCTLSSAVINKLIVTSVLTVSNVSGTNLSYDSSQNSASQIIVLKP